MRNFVRIAHRGGGTGIYENKIETIKKTVKNDSVDAVEIDVRKTKDHIVVLSHNRGMKIDGRTVWIDQVNFADIKYLGVATLEEVIVLFKKIDKILDIDIKEKSTAHEVAQVLKKNNYFKRVYFSSFDLALLFAIQEEVPHGRYFLSSSMKDSQDFSQRRIVRICLVLVSMLLSRVAIFILKKRFKKVTLDGISLFYRFTTKAFVDDLHAFGFKVFVWGTDKEKELKKMIAINVDGIKTKNIALFKKISH